MTQNFLRFLADSRGATAIEYAIIAAFLSMLILVGVTSIGSSLTGIFGEVSSGLQ